jgi:diamine N-acetyltransferase
MSQSEISVSKTSIVTLREVTKENHVTILDLRVTPEQEKFVAGNAFSVAQAYFEEKAWFRAIYADDTPVGFVMLYDDAAKSEYFLWRFMIDRRYQKFGLGKQAIALLIEHVKSRPNATELGVSCVPGDVQPRKSATTDEVGTSRIFEVESPCPFYEKLGFVYTGEKDGDELIMKLQL